RGGGGSPAGGASARAGVGSAGGPQAQDGGEGNDEGAVHASTCCLEVARSGKEAEHVRLLRCPGQLWVTGPGVRWLYRCSPSDSSQRGDARTRPRTPHEESELFPRCRSW